MPSRDDRAYPESGDVTEPTLPETAPVDEVPEVQSSIGSDGSETDTSSEGDESDKASLKTNDDRSDVGDDDVQDPDASGSGEVVSTTTANLEKIIADEFDEANKKLMKKIDDAKTSQECEDVLKEAKFRTKFFYDIFLKCQAKQKVLKKKENDAKKAEEKEKKKAEEKARKASEPTNLTVNINMDGKNYPITIPKSATFKTIRDILNSTHPQVFATKRFTKNLKFIYKEMDLSDHSRRTAQGWDMKEGDVIYVQPRGAGGGKRQMNTLTGKSKDDQMKTLEESIGMAVLRISAHPHASPAIEKMKSQVSNITQSIKAGQVNMDTFFQSLPDKSMERLLTITSVSTKVESRCKAVSDIVFESLLSELNEVKTQLEASYHVLPVLIQYVLMENFGDQSGNIQWSAMMTSISQAVKSKAVANASRTPTAGGLPSDEAL
eukprot:Skav205058  [mRNA]  locus=scaffold142:231626:232930:+ [translate_table: standard]